MLLSIGLGAVVFILLIALTVQCVRIHTAHERSMRSNGGLGGRKRPTRRKKGYEGIDVDDEDSEADDLDEEEMAPFSRSEVGTLPASTALPFEAVPDPTPLPHQEEAPPDGTEVSNNVRPPTNMLD